MLREYIKGTSLETFFLDEDWKSKIGKPWELLSISKEILTSHDLCISKKANIERGSMTVGKVGIGDNTIVSGLSYIVGPVLIGEDCVIGPFVFIRPYSIIGDNVIIGAHSTITDSLVRGESAIYHRCGVGRSILGSNCIISANVVIASTRFNQKENVFYEKNGNLIDTGRKKFGCVMGNNTQIGSHVLVLAGRDIGENCAIGGHVIVKKNIPDNTLVYVNQNLVYEKYSPPKLNIPKPKIKIEEDYP